MKNQNCVSCLENFGTTNQKLLRLYIFTLITLLTHSCDGGASGQVINATMFEIPSNVRKSYLLRDCRKMAGDDIDCKCAYLGRECQQADVENCRNCSCLDGSTKIFYVKKRYGAVCLSVNNVFNAAGFGERFLIHNHIFKLCAQADGSIRHTKDCNFNDLRQEWLWTPGNLLMNAQTSTCLQAKKTTKANFLSMTVTQCNSPDLGQKWRCDDSRQLWGTSLDSLNITHAVRYYSGDKYLKARSVKYLVSPGNIWTVFPSNNRSVCSASHNEGRFYLGDENTKISQIDLGVPCPNGGCSKKLLTSMSSNNLSNCTILWDERFLPNSEPLVVENREDGLYFEWKSNPYTRLKGRILDMTVECVRTATAKFEEYLFRLRVKDITFKRVQEQHQIIQAGSGEISSIPIVVLDKDCRGNLCFRKITVASTLNKTTTVCAIQWKESTLSRLDNTSVATENIQELLSLRKFEETFTLEWNLTQARLLANITFNLTILCYNDENENTTTVEKSALVFQTRYGFISEKSSGGSSADKSRIYIIYLATILPLLVVLLLVIVLILWFLRRRKQRIKESTSKHNLHSNVEHQYSNGSVNSGLQLNSNGVECKSEDNPVYEHCTVTAHPTVTIARNKLYECSNNVKARADSDIYEKPIEGIKVRQNEFYASVDPSKNSPRLKPHPTPRSSPKPSPNLSPKPAPTPQPAKKPPTPPRYKKKMNNPPEEDEQDVYDQPLGFIPCLQKKQEDKKRRDEIPLEDFENQRVHSTYEKPLPDSPPRSGIYDYATREELTTAPTRCEAEKPLEFTKGKENNGSVNSNGSLYDAPHYDVLERN